MTRHRLINLRKNKYLMIQFRVNTVLDLGLYLHLPIRDLGRSRNKKNLIVIEIVADHERIEETKIALKDVETIANNPNIEMIVIETEKGIIVIGIETEIENMMIVEIVEIEIEKEIEEDLEIKTEEIKNKKLKALNKSSILTTNYYLIKYQCRLKSLCHQFQGSVVVDKDPDLHLDIIEETKIITKVSSGTHFHGYLELTIPQMSHLQH